MESTTISTSMAPEVIIGEVTDNLSIRGWDSAKVVIKAPKEKLEVKEGEDTIHLDCRDDCSIRLPHDTSLQIQSIGGNATVKNLDDLLKIGEVHGSLNLRNGGAVQVKTVHGQLYAKLLSGDLNVGLVHGNARVREVQGECTLEDVKGNIDIRNIEYDQKVTAEGNIRMRANMLSGTAYSLNAKGNLHCRIPSDADLDLLLSSEGEVIKLRLPDGSQTIQEKSYQLTLGNGGVDMELAAGGNLHLQSEGDFEEVDYGFDEDFGEQIAQQIRMQIQAQMEAVTGQIEQQMETLTEQIGSAGLSPEETERIIADARQISEREAVKIQRAQEKLERKLEAARRKRELKAQAAQRRTRNKSAWDFSVEGKSTPPKEPVSEEERLMILRMLEEKKVSLDEAENLLTALENR